MITERKILIFNILRYNITRFLVHIIDIENFLLVDEFNTLSEVVIMSGHPALKSLGF